MARRSRIGVRLVSLVAVAATLLAAWLPPSSACACEAVGKPLSRTVATSQLPPNCPCCSQRPAPGKPLRPCCFAPTGTTHESGPTGCRCGALNPQDDPQPAVPPTPFSFDDAPILIAASMVAASVDAALTTGPTVAEAAAYLAAPPPDDLVISLSRFTC